MRVWVIALLLALVALAGCTDNDEPTDGDNTGGDGTDGNDGGNTGGNGNETGNQTTAALAPVGEFTPSTNEGEAPLDVTFEFNASDVDSTELTWVLDADGDGEPETQGTQANLPGNFTFTYATAGQYQASFVVSDGDSNHTLIELITANEPAGSEEPGEPEEPPQFEDRGWYLYEIATSQCHSKDFTETAPGLVYRSAASGGDWFFVETNSVEGLQFENNHPAADVPGAGFALDIPDCTDGDLTAV